MSPKVPSNGSVEKYPHLPVLIPQIRIYHPSRRAENIMFEPMSDPGFQLGGAGYGQVKKLKNKITILRYY